MKVILTFVILPTQKIFNVETKTLNNTKPKVGLELISPENL